MAKQQALEAPVEQAICPILAQLLHHCLIQLHTQLRVEEQVPNRKSSTCEHTSGMCLETIQTRLRSTEPQTTIQLRRYAGIFKSPNICYLTMTVGRIRTPPSQEILRVHKQEGIHKACCKALSTRGADSSTLLTPTIWQS